MSQPSVLSPLRKHDVTAHSLSPVPGLCSQTAWNQNAEGFLQLTLSQSSSSCTSIPIRARYTYVFSLRRTSVVEIIPTCDSDVSRQSGIPLCHLLHWPSACVSIVTYNMRSGSIVTYNMGSGIQFPKGPRINYSNQNGSVFESVNKMFVYLFF